MAGRKHLNGISARESANARLRKARKATMDNDVEAFLADGGKIMVVEQGVTGQKKLKYNKNVVRKGRV